MRFKGSTGWWLSLLVALMSCGGCAMWQPQRLEPTPEAAVSTPSTVDPVVSLLEYARQLAQDSPDAREAAVMRDRHAVQRQPNGAHYARLALALGTPGQHLYTPDEAARYAQRALEANDSHWSPASRQYLHDYARLYTALTQSGTAQGSDRPDGGRPHADDHDKQRIAELQRQLDEAHRKLVELVNIENQLDTNKP